MDGNFLSVTVYDQTTKKSRTLSVSSGCRLHQLRQLIEKQWQLKDFRFFNEGSICIRGTQKHIPIQIYLKAYNTITIATQRQQPKKQSKLIQKSKKQVMIRHTLPRPQPQPQRRVLTSKDFKSMTTQQTISQKHFKWNRQNIEYCKFRYNVDLSQDGYGLDHDYTAIDMDEFTKYDWGNIEWLGLYGCGIDDNGWRMFVNKAEQFSRLKILGIKDNQITTVKQGDLQAFRSLKMVQFGTISGPNPLTEQTKQYLKKFRTQNPQIRVKYRH